MTERKEMACVRTKGGFKSTSHKQREETFTTLAAGSKSTFLSVDSSLISRIQQFGGDIWVTSHRTFTSRDRITGKESSFPNLRGEGDKSPQGRSLLC